MKDLVSICIPVRNGRKYLEECLNSALAQTYRPLEIVVSDDYSNDGSIDIIRSFNEAGDIPIHIYSHTPTSIGENWNNCIANSNGAYIKFLFQDDLLEPYCVEKMMSRVIQENINFVFCKRKILSSDVLDKKWARRWILNNADLSNHWPDKKIPNQVDGRELIHYLKKESVHFNMIGEPTAVLFSKELAKRNGYFDTELKQLLDVEGWYRLIKNAKIGFINDSLVSFRLHDDQASYKNQKGQRRESLLFRKKIVNGLGDSLNPKTLKALKREIILAKIEILTRSRIALYFRFRIGTARQNIRNYIRSK